MPTVALRSIELPDSSALAAEPLLTALTQLRYGEHARALHKCLEAEVVPQCAIFFRQKLLGWFGAPQRDDEMVLSVLRFAAAHAEITVGSFTEPSPASFFEYSIQMPDISQSTIWFKPIDAELLPAVGLQTPRALESARYAIRLEALFFRAQSSWACVAQRRRYSRAEVEFILRLDELGGFTARRLRIRSWGEGVELSVGGSVNEEQMSVYPKINVGAVALTLEEIQLLRPGSILSFELPSELSVCLELGGRVLGRGILRREEESMTLELTETF